MATRVILASASPGRLDTLRRAGIEPEVIISGVDEDVITAEKADDLVAKLAQAKGLAVAALIDNPAVDNVLLDCPSASAVTTSFRPELTIIIACDSVLEIAGRICGKPETPERAIAQWRTMRGRIGLLHTGHHVQVQRNSRAPQPAEHLLGQSDWMIDLKVATTQVQFADVSDDEIEAYIATGEPLQVAGAFTTDGYGGAFVKSVHGDPHNVVGISLPLLRVMLTNLGVTFTDLWRPLNTE